MSNIRIVDGKTNVLLETRSWTGTIGIAEWSSWLLVEPSHTDKLKTFVKNLVDSESRNDFKMDLNKKLYITKWCKLARYKIDDFTKEKGVKRVWDFKQGDYVVINRDELKSASEIILNTYYASHPRTCYIFPSSDPDILPEAKGYSEDVFYVDSSALPSKYFKFLKNFDTYNTNALKGRVGIIEILNYLVENEGAFEIVFDDELLNVINGDGIEWSEESYNTIKMMFESKNQDDICLAVETLTHFNFSEHIIEIALLFNQYKYIFYRGAKVIQTQAFKTLDSFLRAKNINYRGKWREFIPSLVKLYPERTEFFSSYIKEMLNNEFNYYSVSIKIEDIKVSFN